ncbi:IclR family transcriptional regulator C-terminal domain-containing protein [Aquabacterium sp. J223]|uniref:IclR family transcriptional regulator domain-containing protein n=1 Tax=Aquabacterium sp. J223 TaxID=2898431 RepID=UPI0039175615
MPRGWSSWPARTTRRWRATAPAKRCGHRSQRTWGLPDDLVQRVRQVREQGHAVVDRLLPLELRLVAVPVPGDDGRPVAALVTGTEAERHGAAGIAAERLPLLRSTARELAGQLLAAAMPPR